ncbi:lactosylceramide 1,3-N-acetyl-beta-D-glucosaminyltransferase isoform X2 [Odocoileus virginianus]|uniref:Lactosylceramide 1,3-N-acetyl-beta-D-glucosaminyltransferase isoform X2 n=1 Tax=Odocoileus virginianus TaxID=9874 RepID=A0ABM4I3P4_ODOVR
MNEYLPIRSAATFVKASIGLPKSAINMEGKTEELWYLDSIKIGLIYKCGQDRRDSFDDSSEECGNNYIQNQCRGCKSPQVQQLSYFHWLIVERPP